VTTDHTAGAAAELYVMPLNHDTESAAHDSDKRIRARLLRTASLVVVATVLCVGSFVAGRLVEHRANQSAISKQDSGPNVTAPPTNQSTNPNNDENRREEIAQLNGQVSEMNWQLVSPFKEFEAGKIDAATLRQRTAEPEVKILRLCTRMHELSNEIEDAETRKKVVNYTAAILQRQRGFSMMIEGISLDDESRVAEGAKLFEDGRNKTLAAAVEIGGSDNPQSAHLKRLLDAYESSENRP
jgi:hypothetical protein